jgi:multiple sugar transport system substrate-binding protein
MRGRWWIVVVVGACVSLMLIACQGKGTATNGSDVSDQAKQVVQLEPVTVTLYNSIGLTKDEGDQLIVQPVKKKYPHITVSILDKETVGKFEQYVAAGNYPDIVYAKAEEIGTLIGLKMNYDMRELVKSQQFDLDRIESSAMDSVKVWGKQGEIYALPNSLNFRALFYNKDIFDMFGVPYPKASMTWERTIGLARKTSRIVDGTHFRGLAITNIVTFSAGYSLPYADAASHQALLDSEGWKKAFALAKSIFEVPGNEFDPALYTQKGAEQAFIKDGVLAMYAEKNMLGLLADVPANGMNWDVTTYPSFEERPGLYGWDVPQVVAIDAISKHKEDAFRVVSVLLSDEVQMEASRRGKMSPLENAKVQRVFGEDLGYLKGKNLQAIFESQPAKPPVQTDFDSIAVKALTKGFSDMMVKGTDVNSALRNINETANKQIKAELSK